MTQEDKKLLLKDLAARLPHKVKMYVGEDLAMTLRQIDYKGFCESWENGDFRCHSSWMLPYLRPISSMTEEEYKEYSKLWGLQDEFSTDADIRFKTDVIDWLNARHFDYRGLIERGLAIEVTEDNNPYKE